MADLYASPSVIVVVLHRSRLLCQSLADQTAPERIYRQQTQNNEIGDNRTPVRLGGDRRFDPGS